MVKQLAAALSNAQEYINLAAKAEDGGERERYERIAELYLKIKLGPQIERAEAKGPT